MHVFCRHNWAKWLYVDCALSVLCPSITPLVHIVTRGWTCGTGCVKKMYIYFYFSIYMFVHVYLSVIPLRNILISIYLFLYCGVYLSLFHIFWWLDEIKIWFAKKGRSTFFLSLASKRKRAHYRKRKFYEIRPVWVLPPDHTQITPEKGLLPA